MAYFQPDNKMHVCFILPSLSIGGAEKVILQLMNNISCKVSLILLERDGMLEGQLSSIVSVYGLNKKNIRSALFPIIKLIPKIRPDLLFTTSAHISVSILLIKFLLPKNIKYIIRESNMPSVNLKNNKKALILKYLYKWSYKYANAIVCPGSSIKNDLNAIVKLRDKTFSIIPNPIDTKGIRKRLKTNIDIKKDNGCFHLLAAGSFTPQKGFDMLIEAMADLIKRLEHVRLTILGDGQEKDRIIELIERYNLWNHVELKGYKSDVFPYFASSDLFVLTSRWEGLPNVVLESLACGTPVVAFNCPGCLDEIIETNQQGYLVRLGDIKRFSMAIEAMLKKNISGIKHNLLPPRFDMDSVVQQYEQLFTNVLQN